MDAEFTRALDMCRRFCYNSGMNSIYISKSGDGHLNLAMDEYLLEQYRKGKALGVTLYFYVNSAAVIIGRNQNAWRECNTAKMEREGVRLVRRHTGGGAVFHDAGNLNFSFITDEKLYDKARQTRVVLRALMRLGIHAEVTGRNDLTVGGRKFSGCAYALSGKARGMHGTLLINTDFGRLSEYLNPSRKKLAAKGITSVRSRVVNLSELADVSVDRARELIIEEFIAEYGEAEEFVPDASAMKEVERIAARQRSWEWIFGQSPVFDYELDERFSFGELQLRLNVRNGEISEIAAYTDAMNTSLPEELTKLLSGCRFEGSAVSAALRAGGEEANELAVYFENENMGGGNVLTSIDTELIKDARRKLHSIPELAFEERATKAFIIDFLRKNTSLEIHDEGDHIYAAHRENAAKTIAVRADFDAVPTGSGACHLCGHDGHTAALLGLALLLEGKTIGRNVILLFQPAEETGAGAPRCRSLFEKESVDLILGAHNIPGISLGTVLLRKGTFACASCGLEISMRGSPTHAAYPENGINPTKQLAKLAVGIPELAEKLSLEYGCMSLATVVGMRTGEKAFGVAASEGSLWITLRSECAEAFNELVETAKTDARAMASDARAAITITEYDPFPATVNDELLVDSAERMLKAESLPYNYIDKPFRWSEDFGHYGKYARAMFFGIGSGEDTAPLHTAEYEYPDELAAITSNTFYKMVKSIE